MNRTAYESSLLLSSICITVVIARGRALDDLSRWGRTQLLALNHGASSRIDPAAMDATTFFALSMSKRIRMSDAHPLTNEEAKRHIFTPDNIGAETGSFSGFGYSAVQVLYCICQTDMA